MNGCALILLKSRAFACQKLEDILFVHCDLYIITQGNNDVPHSPLYARGHPSVGRVIRDIYINVRNRTTRFGFAGDAHGHGDHNEDDVPLLAAGEAVKDDDAIYEDPVRL